MGHRNTAVRRNTLLWCLVVEWSNLIKIKESDSMNVWLETLTGLMRENLWFAPVLSLVAGVVTSFYPLFVVSSSDDFGLCGSSV